MVVENSHDGEGILLDRIRKTAPDLPIAVALDFHTNLGEEMVKNATEITGYRTYPHIDMHETGLRARKTLLEAIKSEVDPVMVWGKQPIVPHMLFQSPARQRMKDIMDLSIALEDSSDVLYASVIGGFPLPKRIAEAMRLKPGDRIEWIID
jgi:microcystin degradation protein MlrC